MTTVYVGDNSKEFAEKIKRIDDRATLVNRLNFSTWRLLECAYTSVADLDEKQMIELCSGADRVVYDKIFGRKLQYTENILSIVMNIRKVENFTLSQRYNDFLTLADHRKSEDPVLWCAGCSYTYGVGVNESQRYSTILANRLNMPMSLLACPGSSIIWAADQILRSDIRSGDIVVWGLTGNYRLPYWKDKEYHVLLSSKLKIPFDINRLLEPDLIYRNVRAIYQVINFCEKSGAELYLAGLLDVAEHSKYLHDKKNYIPTQHPYLDLGSDEEHPGPLQHQNYADLIFQRIKGKI